jgi:hypothetical protein
MLSITLVWCERVLIDVAAHWSLVILIFTFFPTLSIDRIRIDDDVRAAMSRPLPIIGAADRLCAIALRHCCTLSLPPPAARRSTLAPQKIPTFMQ